MTIAAMKDQVSKAFEVAIAIVSWIAQAAAELAKALAVIAAGFGVGTTVEVGTATLLDTPPAVASSATPEQASACPSP